MPQTPIKVLFCVWELEPFLKVGGLGELARSLPRALTSRGIDIRVILPKYSAIRYHGKPHPVIGETSVLYGKKRLAVSVHRSSFLSRDIPVYFLEHAEYFSRIEPETFPVFSAAVVAALEQQVFGWQPDIIHCNDHHTGLIPLLIKSKGLHYKTIFTIHSVKNQGRISKEYALDIGIPEQNLTLLKWEIASKQLNQLLEGIINADIVNTVSPTYAREIMYEPYGYDMEYPLRQARQKNRYYAVVNGIDHEFKDPASADVLYPYTVATALRQKEKNKMALQRKAGFRIKPHIPLAGFIGRLQNNQKGIDRLMRMLLRTKDNSIQFVIMGKGELAWEERLTTTAAFNPKTIKVYTEFDENLATAIYAAADFLLVPSNFEPCGQVQMHAMRYGALPIVRATGGLSDTVTDGHNGYVYTGESSFDLERALKRAVKRYHTDTPAHAAMVTNAMNTDNSWDVSAAAYHALYRQLVTGEASETAHLTVKLPR